MKGETFYNVGWLILIGIAFTWLKFGYSNVFLLLVPLAYICFLMANGTIKKLRIVNNIPIGKIGLILLSFVFSVAIFFGLIYYANYLINEKWVIEGGIKAILEIIAIMISLYPIKFTFGTMVEYFTKNLKEREE